MQESNSSDIDVFDFATKQPKISKVRQNTKLSGKNRYDKLQRLYKQANKVYFKGIQSNDMIVRLDIEKITKAVKDQLNPLYKELGVDKTK